MRLALRSFDTMVPLSLSTSRTRSPCRHRQLLPYESAGKRTSGKTRPGHRCLCTVSVQAAHAAARTRSTHLSAQYRRLATRRGKKRALMAVAPAMRVMAYSMTQRQEPYREAGGDFFDRLQPEDTARRLVKRLEHLGYHAALQHPSTDSTP